MVEPKQPTPVKHSRIKPEMKTVHGSGVPDVMVHGSSDIMRDAPTATARAQPAKPKPRRGRTA
jgi:hypothetical protein